MKAAILAYEPLQSRSRATLERALTAALEILEKDGWQAFTVAKVCQRSGMSAGTFYRRFKDREELLKVLQDRWIADSVEVLREVSERTIDWRALSPSAALEEIISLLAESFERDQVRLRLFGLHGSFDDDGLKKLQELSQGFRLIFKKALHGHTHAIIHDDPGRAIDFCFRIAIDSLIRHATHYQDYDIGGAVRNWSEFVSELTNMCSGYLFGDLRSRDD